MREKILSYMKENHFFKKSEIDKELWEDTKSLLKNLVKEWLLRRYKKWVYWEANVYYWEVRNQKLFNKSYVSFENALSSFYHIIPEWVFLTQSAVSKKDLEKTKKLNEDSYRYISVELFSFKYTKLLNWDNWFKIRIASKERAIFDWLLHNKEEIIDDWKLSQFWDQWYRFDNLEDVNEELILSLCKKTSDKKLISIWNTLYRYIKRYKKENAWSWTEVKTFLSWSKEQSFNF